MRPLLLLHGALGGPDTLQLLAARLQPHFSLHCPAFPGHAGVRASEYRMDALVDFLAGYVRAEGLERPLVFGYSMGGYAALALAAQQPGVLGGIATLATKLRWTPEAAAREGELLRPEVLEAKVPAYAAALAGRHGLHWKEVVRGTAALLQGLGDAPLLNAAAFARIQEPVLLLLGDRDKMVSLDETLEAFQQIGGAQLGVLPGTAHPLEKVPVDLLSAQLLSFFQNKNS